MNLSAPDATRINGLSKQELANAINLMQGDSSKAKFQFQTRSQWLDGGQVRSTVKDFYGLGRPQNARLRPFVLDTDLLPGMGGSKDHSSPMEMLLAAMTACVTTSFVAEASTMGIHIDDLCCEARADIDLRGMHGVAGVDTVGFTEVRVVIALETQAKLRHLQVLLDKVKARSPVYQMLCRSTSVVMSYST